jgi:hypothetical protein
LYRPGTTKTNGKSGKEKTPARTFPAVKRTVISFFFFPPVRGIIVFGQQHEWGKENMYISVIPAGIRTRSSSAPEKIFVSIAVPQ